MTRAVQRSALLAIAVLALAAKPAPEPPKYEITNTFKIGGDGHFEGVYIDSDGKWLYIPRNGRTLIADAASGKVSAEILGKGLSRGIVLVPELNRGFISNERENTVTVFDLKTNSVLGKIAIDGLPASMIYEPTSKRVMVCCVEGKCLVPVPADVDLNNPKLPAAIELGGRPTGLVVDHEGTVYVDIVDNDEVGVIDAKTMTLLTRWQLGNSNRPTGISIDHTKGRLFVGFRLPKLVVLSIVDGREIASLQLPAPPDSTVFHGGRLFVLCTEGSLVIIGQAADGKYEIQQTLKVGAGARMIAVHPKTGALYVPTIDLEGRRPVRDSFKIHVVENVAAKK